MPWKHCNKIIFFYVALWMENWFYFQLANNRQINVSKNSHCATWCSQAKVLSPGTLASGFSCDTVQIATYHSEMYFWILLEFCGVSHWANFNDSNQLKSRMEVDIKWQQIVCTLHLHKRQQNSTTSFYQPDAKFIRLYHTVFIFFPLVCHYCCGYCVTVSTVYAIQVVDSSK